MFFLSLVHGLKRLALEFRVLWASETKLILSPPNLRYFAPGNLEEATENFVGGAIMVGHDNGF